MAVALVTGSAKGIGKALILALAEDGYDIVVHYLSSQADANKVVKIAQNLGVKAISLHADVTLPAQATKLIQESYHQFGRLDVLINNVGNYYKGPLESFSVQQWHDTFNSNLHSTFYTCQAALPLMRKTKYGRIINIGFAGAERLMVKSVTSAYTIAKTGVILYSKALAKSEAKYNITINVISPGVIENSISKPLNAIPMKRIGLFSEMVGAMRYFLAKESAYVTGVTIEIAGGWNL